MQAHFFLFYINIIFVTTLYSDHIKEHFTNINTSLPGIHFDMRYAGTNNFIGQPVEGYERSICYLTHEAATALAEVQSSLHKRGLSLRVFDCYRPQRAVDHFVRWAKDLNDTRMKSAYYPNVQKKDLFKKGYIAAKSGHSRGSTVDLTIEGLDMGTSFDFFDPRSHTDSHDLNITQHANRMYLKTIMEENGFVNYSAEWWHYTLKDEPFKKTYFDFVIK